MHLRFSIRSIFAFITFLSAIFISSMASATVYSDGEDGGVEWAIVDNNPTGAAVRGLFDNRLDSNVVFLKGTQSPGNGGTNAFLVGGKVNNSGWGNSSEFQLNWKMRTSLSYSVIVFVHTDQGLRRLIYTQRDTDQLLQAGTKNIRYGLGESTRDGNWHSISRNLQADLESADTGNTLINVNGVMVRGNMRIDDVSLDGGDVDPSSNEPPTPVIVASQVSGDAPLEVTFDASSSRSEPPAELTEFSWDFGNGDVSDQAVAETSFTQTGSYDVTLTVTDSTGKSSSAESTIEVNGAVDNGSKNLCEGGYISTDRVVIPQMDKPAYMQSYTDPAFGSKVTRITNSNANEVRKPVYSTIQAWNADESLILLYRAGNGGGYHFLLDGQTYQPVRDLDIYPSDIEEVFWSHTDPDTFFYVSQGAADYGEFKRYSVAAGESTKITDFTSVCGSGLPLAGSDVHMQSHDDDLFGFRCENDSGDYQMLSYRISTDKTSSAPIGSGTPWADRTTPTAGPSGERFWYQGSTLNTNLTSVQHDLDVANIYEHSSVGQTHNGQDALYQTVFDPSPQGCDGDSTNGVGHLVQQNLETGKCRSIVNQTQGYPYTTSGTHVSALATKQPGWVAISSIGESHEFAHFTNNQPAPALLSEIYLASTDPDNPVTCRLAHHRTFGKRAFNGTYEPYFGEPHVTISPSGTRMLFGSDWYDSGSVDTYVLELPGYK